MRNLLIVLLLILLSPIILVAVVVILIAAAAIVAGQFAWLRWFCLRNRGQCILVCTTRRGWHPLLANNVVPLLRPLDARRLVSAAA